MAGTDTVTLFRWVVTVDLRTNHPSAVVANDWKHAFQRGA